ncbi:hypothetical protein ACOBV8_20240 (plasmid) [Pseudoalteromonas espejiana]
MHTLIGSKEELINSIQEQINEEQEEFKQQTASERKSERLERQLDYYQQWLGKLSDTQTALISTANNKHHDSKALWLLYKQTRLNAAERVLTNNALNDNEFVEQLSL